jgi:hypothetical protein
MAKVKVSPAYTLNGELQYKTSTKPIATSWFFLSGSKLYASPNSSFESARVELTITGSTIFLTTGNAITISQRDHPYP